MRLSVIIPAFNEAHRIADTLRAVVDHLDQTDTAGTIIVVDDGSTDSTADQVAQFVDEGPSIPVVLLSNDRNRGKGYSVRRGMLEADGDLRLMMDADLSTPMNQLPKLMAAIERGAKVAIGSRSLRASILRPPQPRLRRWAGAVMRSITVRRLLPNIHDTQCGFKLFTADAAQQIFSRSKIDGFAFDVEALLIAQQMGMRIAEIPILWHNVTDSRVKLFRDGWRMWRDVRRLERQIRNDP